MKQLESFVNAVTSQVGKFVKVNHLTLASGNTVYIATEYSKVGDRNNLALLVVAHIVTAE